MENARLAVWLREYSGRSGWGPLGPFEYAVMTALWADGPSTVRQLGKRFPRAAYTSVMTAMQRMSRKGLLSRERRGRVHVYRAAMSRQTLRAEIVACFLAEKFAGPCLVPGGLNECYHALPMEPLETVTARASTIRARAKSLQSSWPDVSRHLDADVLSLIDFVERSAPILLGLEAIQGAPPPLQSLINILDAAASNLAQYEAARRGAQS